MQNEIFIFVFGLLALIVILDIVSYRAIHRILKNVSPAKTHMVNIVFWGISVVNFLFLVWIVYNRKNYDYTRFYFLTMKFFGLWVLFYLPKLFLLVFILLQDVVNAGGWMISIIFRKRLSENVALRVSRRNFITKAGLILSAIPFLSVLHGIFIGRNQIRVKRVKMEFPDLPDAFKGIRMVQISDLHLGSFGGDTGFVEEVVGVINDLEPDYIFFTGDMVNSLAGEMKDFVPVLSNLRAREGKFSILGNHDYGDDFPWESEEDSKENLGRLEALEEEAGFTLLRNESVVLERRGQNVDLIGVENWGEPPFPQYGDLEASMSGLPADRFKILLSHDPSHWDAEVLGKTRIDLTFSGHTHGFQFAVGIGNARWSPVQLKYPRWSGLYREGSQALYVNTGLGFIGFPGRVGTPPEITLIEL